MDLSTLTERINNIIQDCREYVTRVEFDSRISPLEKIVYGFVGLVLVSVAGAIIALVIRK